MAIEKIQDFGDTVAGAKKALWRERGFMQEDITDMAEKEIVSTVIKKNIWKEPDYIALYNEGCYREDLYYLKLCYTSLGASIAPTLTEKVKNLAEEYADFLISLREWIMPKIKEHTLNYNTDLCGWLLNNGYMEAKGIYSNSLTRKASCNSAFSSSFVSFINQNIRGFSGALRNSEMRELLQQAHGDTEECKQARQQLCLKTARSKNYASNSFFIDCYASGFPFNYIAAVKHVVCWQITKGDNEHIYKIGPKTSAAVKIEYPCEEKESLDRILMLIADGTYTKDYQTALDMRKEKKNVGTTIDAEKKTINVERTALPNMYVLRKGPRMRKNDAQITALLYDENNVNMVSCFNFRGGEFGNWQNKRQECLNCAVDSFSDLAYVTDLPFSAMSVCFTGLRQDRLTIAWGSRGSGNAAAHYEPTTTVINLTKYKGAGSLAHEWGHALDHAIGKWCLKGCKTTVTKQSTSEFATNLYKHTGMSEDEVIVLKQVSKVMTLLKRKEKVLSAEEKQAYFNDILNMAKDRVQDCLKYNLTENTYRLDKTKEQAVSLINKANEDLLQGNTTVEEYVQLLRKNGFKNDISKNRMPLFTLDLKTLADPTTIKVPDTVTTDTEYYSDAQKLDVNRKKAYYSQNVELFARAFESYVADELHMRNMATQYLVHGTDGKMYKAIYNASPYPMGDERKAFNAAFRELMNTVAEIIVGARFEPKFKAIYQQAGFVETKYFEGEATDKTVQQKENLQVKAAVSAENIKRERAVREAGRVTLYDADSVVKNAANLKETETKLQELSGEVPDYNSAIHCTVTAFNEQTQVVAVRGIGDSEVQHVTLKVLAQLVSSKVVKVTAGVELLPTYVTTVIIPTLA